MSEDIVGVRAHLFATLKGLKDGSITPEKARAINETAQVIVNTAKVEVDNLRATNRISGSGFFPEQVAPAVPALRNNSLQTGTGHKHIDLVDGGSITNHRMR